MGKKLLAFLGPGYLVAVGYMDPGNWATSLAGGSKFGYALLTIALLSNMMAILLQALCARLGIGAGRDLAQACRDAFPRAVSWPLWVLAEIAICATDLAEVIGTAIGLNLLFGIPLEIGVIITALDVFLILWMQTSRLPLDRSLHRRAARRHRRLFRHADRDGRIRTGARVILGFAPTTEIVTNPDMLYLALGILGATVMPHNLYLHSGVVQTRRFGESVDDTARGDHARDARFNHRADVRAAHQRLDPHSGGRDLLQGRKDRCRRTRTGAFVPGAAARAPPLRRRCSGSRCLCCGLNSTVTATLAGQIVMEGFIDIRLPAWARRLIDAGDRHRAGRDRDHLVRRGGHRAAPDPQSGGARACSCRSPSCRW